MVGFRFFKRIDLFSTQYCFAQPNLDFTDAAIIAIAERLTITRVYTLDRRDFSIIRPSHCDYFELFP
ncbi:hypothetical protein VL20_1074 [Microcystis panniformis FACHB-1757]|uniref:PIN domain-containing protein n=1 Tax=Microcystis panniformis FACHB-1757 TaxID=1638788 RepID=A0A0K1RX36_9CHRO|nr:hypothetical protein VL20_1074 [Microcystis panniformis FACHB-1757]